MILPKYIITNKTCAILPAKQMHYQAIIIEEKDLFHVSKPPVEIIKESCIHYWASYEGIRDAVIHHLGYKQKTPIPVSVNHNLCFLPTHAPTHMDTCWINRAQVNHWGRMEKVERTKEKQTEIMFHNGYKVDLEISLHTLQQQMERAFRVIVGSGMVAIR